MKKREGSKLENCLYTVKLIFTKLSPPVVHGGISRIGRKKLLEKLKRYGLTERDVDRSKQSDETYTIWLGGGYLLVVKPVERGF